MEKQCVMDMTQRKEEQLLVIKDASSDQNKGWAGLSAKQWDTPKRESFGSNSKAAVERDKEQRSGRTMWSV